MTKDEAAGYLGIAKRTLEKYQTEKLIKSKLIKGKRSMIADFEKADLDRLKATLEDRKATALTIVPVERAAQETLEKPTSVQGLFGSLTAYLDRSRTICLKLDGDEFTASLTLKRK